MAHVTLDEALETASATTVEEIRALYVRHGAKLRQTLARLAPEVDADDLLQETFLIALSKTEALAHAQSQFAWLYGIAVKLAATRRRTARLRRFFGLDPRLEAPPQDSAARTTEERDARRRVFAALDT
ncbi:MAG TPA: sigma factor, partial [Archangium sp.]